jgi:pimeloyl-ACP methyl ester carboxylesterase
MRLFVLVHGAYHGGWCWSRLVPELELLGHRAVTPDLPCDDPTAGHAANVATVLAAMDEADAGSDVVVVGHSQVADDLRARLVTERYGAMVRFATRTAGR